MRLETFARAGLPLQIEFFVDLFGAEVLEDGAPCGDRSEWVRDSWCNREQRVRYVTSERSTASTRSVLAQSPGGEAAWAHCPAEAVRTPLVWLRRADASDESARTQRDFDRDDSESTGVQGMPQMARSIGTPGCHPTAKHIGVQHINEYHWISVISRLVVCSAENAADAIAWSPRFGRTGQRDRSAGPASPPQPAPTVSARSAAPSGCCPDALPPGKTSAATAPASPLTWTASVRFQ